ncbi:MAG: dTMP kinase [Methanolinea sp.]|nr:dTMP kinase [Methanolinea sp.]
MLITLEGIDGSGKSSLIFALRELLADLDPVFTREPGATWVGEQVRRAIAERADPVTEALLFAADHAAHIRTVIRPALDQGRLVISDRYTDSRYAYQTATLEGVVPDPLAWLKAVHDGWTIPPDRTVLLLLPVTEALQRKAGSQKNEHFEEASLLERVQANYLRLARDEPERFLLVDAGRPEKEVHFLVAAAIREWCGLLRSHRRRYGHPPLPPQGDR